MNTDDLKFIFRQQIEEEQSQNLFFFVYDDDEKTAVTHPVIELENLLPMLDCFQYGGNEGTIPFFVK
jgi:hypothetical protein